MQNSTECWIPELEEIKDFGKWDEYVEHIYDTFKKDFVENCPLYEGKSVYHRKEPIEYGKEECFFHITCNDYMKTRNRNPDLRRCERIKWVRSFIENQALCETCDDKDVYCSGVLVWSEPHHGKERIHILHEDERYIVVMEKRKNYYLLITAFYIEYDHTIDKYIKRYEKQKTPY